MAVQLAAPLIAAASLLGKSIPTAVKKFGQKVISPRNVGQESIKKAAQGTAEYAKGQAKAGGATGTVVLGGQLLYQNVAKEDLPSIIEEAEAKNIPLDILDGRVNPEDYPIYQKDSDSAKAFRAAQRVAKAAKADIFMFEGRLYSTEEAVESKAMGGSMLSRQNYEEGSKTQTSKEVLDEQVKFYRMLMEGAKTPEQEQIINDSFGDSLPDILKRMDEMSQEEADNKMAMGGMMYAKGSLVGRQSELDKNKDGEITAQDFAMLRQGKQEGGSLMVPPEMEGMMADDMPVDTYPNIPPEEMAAAQASQLPDAEMEDKYMDFVVNESLDSEEQSYLMNALEADPMLSQIFDKVLMTASEFTGAGEVEGPGTGVSDSIPARLSDGEFVFTKKATDQIGADNLQMMMDDAERAFDGGEMRMPKQEGGMMMYKQKDEDPLAYEKIAQDEIKKNMLRANRAPSLLGVN
jgi:hypothetical protein|tara:strand:- start:4696 stop:6081 length:1386 start_codon:yes stop_codon:yes gene_type:complete